MTKPEAILAMKQGKKVSHIHFSPNEWMTMEGNKIVLEDGVVCSEAEFWHWRTNSSWDNDYFLFTY